jgi:hypothetical protein
MYLSLHRKYLSLTRILMLLSLLAFALGSLAHAGHNHDKQPSQHQTCGYCVSYGHLAAGNVHVVSLSGIHFTDEVPVDFSQSFIPLRHHVAAQPRAPPTL